MQYNAIQCSAAMQCYAMPTCPHGYILHTYAYIYIHTYTHILTSTHVCTYQGHTPAGLLACWLAGLLPYLLTHSLIYLQYLFTVLAVLTVLAILTVLAVLTVLTVDALSTYRTYGTYRTYSSYRVYSTCSIIHIDNIDILTYSMCIRICMCIYIYIYIYM